VEQILTSASTITASDDSTPSFLPYSSFGQFSTDSTLTTSYRSSTTSTHKTIDKTASSSPSTTGKSIPSASSLPNGLIGPATHHRNTALIASVTTICILLALAALALFLFLRRRRRRRLLEEAKVVDDDPSRGPSRGPTPPAPATAAAAGGHSPMRRLPLLLTVPPWPRWPWARLSATELPRRPPPPPADPAAVAAPAAAAARSGESSEMSRPASERTAADFYAPEIRDMLRSADGRSGGGRAGELGAAGGNQVSVRVSMADWTSDDSTSTYQRGRERTRHWIPY
jgi:hypothetical protein